jgi:hypothetical protein
VIEAVVNDEEERKEAVQEFANQEGMFRSEKYSTMCRKSEHGWEAAEAMIITNSEKITSEHYSDAIKNGKVFIDGWTASLNGTLQNYKEAIKIVFGQDA